MCRKFWFVEVIRIDRFVKSSSSTHSETECSPFQKKNALFPNLYIMFILQINADIHTRNNRQVTQFMKYWRMSVSTLNWSTRGIVFTMICATNSFQQQAVQSPSQLRMLSTAWKINHIRLNIKFGKQTGDWTSPVNDYIAIPNHVRYVSGPMIAHHCWMLLTTHMRF